MQQQKGELLKKVDARNVEVLKQNYRNITQTTISRFPLPGYVLLAMLICTLFLTGCAGNKVILHPIDKVDIVEMKKGVAYTPEKDGWFLSKYYLDKVVEARVN